MSSSADCCASRLDEEVCGVSDSEDARFLIKLSRLVKSVFLGSGARASSLVPELVRSRLVADVVGGDCVYVPWFTSES